MTSTTTTTTTTHVGEPNSPSQKQLFVTTRLDQSDSDEDVMAGIDEEEYDDDDDDDDDDDSDSISTSPMMKLIPKSLTPKAQASTKSMLNRESPGGSHLQPEKGVDRLLLLARYPNAREDQIQQALEKKELQQHAARIAATRKAQLYREKRDHEEAALRRKEQLEQQEYERQRQEEGKLLRERLMRNGFSPMATAAIGDHDDDTHGVFEDDDDDENDVIEPKRLSTSSPSVSQASDEDVKSDNTFFQLSMSGESVNPSDGSFGNSPNGVDDSNFPENGYHPNPGEINPLENKPSKQHRSRSYFFMGKFRKVFSKDPKEDKCDYPSHNSTDASENGTLGDETKASAQTRRISNTTNRYKIMYTTRIKTNTDIDPKNEEDDVCDTGSSSYGTNPDDCPNVSMNSDQRLSAKNFHHYNDGSFDDDDDDDDAYDCEDPLASRSKSTKSRHWCLDRRKNQLLIAILSLTVLIATVVTLLAAMKVWDRPSNTTTTTTTSQKNNQNQGVPPLIPVSTFSPTVFDPVTENPSEEEIDASPTNSDLTTSTAETTDANPPSVETSSSSPTRASSVSPTGRPTSSPTIALVRFEEEDSVSFEGFKDIDQEFGSTVALSRNGKTLVVGSPGGLAEAGIVRIYHNNENKEETNGRNFAKWTLSGSLLGRKQGDKFGSNIALSRDGMVLAVGEPERDANGDKAGTVRTYVYSPFGYVSRGPDLEGANATDHFGIGLALSEDGRRLAIGAPYQDNTNGLDGPRSVSGTVYVYEWSVQTKEWLPFGKPLEGIEHMDWFGWTIDLNHNGTLMCAGAPRHLKTGGYVRCFTDDVENSGEWKPLGNPIQNQEGWIRYDDFFGGALSVNSDSKTHMVAIGARGKNNGPNATDVGLVVVYEYDAERGWTQLGREALLGSQDNEQFGYSLDLNGDFLVVGSPGRNTVQLYRFERSKDEWTSGEIVAGQSGSDYGASLSMTPGGELVVGSPGSNDNTGAVVVYHPDRRTKDETILT